MIAMSHYLAMDVETVSYLRGRLEDALELECAGQAERTCGLVPDCASGGLRKERIIVMDATALKETIRLHVLWIGGKAGGIRANLTNANLYRANLANANLTRATLPHFTICPEKGEFIAWKKLQKSIVAELLIPAESKRTSSLVGRKCRAEFVKVISFVNSSESIGYAKHDSTPYIVGQTVKPDSYDDDIRVECTHGIHFFMTNREAENY